MPAVRMMPYLKDASFDPETLQIVTDAFDYAMMSLRGWKQPDVVRKSSHSGFILLATQGERNAVTLIEKALEGIQGRRDVA